MFGADALNFIFQNPLADTTISIITKTAKILTKGADAIIPKANQQPVQQIIKMDPEPLWKLAGRGGIFVKLAAISGSAAVVLGAYGAHTVLPDKDKDENAKVAFQTANRYHFFHTLALLGVPLCRYPAISGSLFILGLTLFSGTCYYYSITGDNRFRRLTPVGGTCLILGWIAMLF